MFFCSFFPPLFSYIKSNRKGLKYDVCISPFRRWGLRRKFLISAQEQVITGDPVLKKKEKKKRATWLLKTTHLFHPLWDREHLREYQILSRSPKPPLLACPQSFDWLVVKVDGDYWSAWRAPVVTAQDWRPHQRDFLAFTGPCLTSVAGTRLPWLPLWTVWAWSQVIKTFFYVFK